MIIIPPPAAEALPRPPIVNCASPANPQRRAKNPRKIPFRREYPRLVAPVAYWATATADWAAVTALLSSDQFCGGLLIMRLRSRKLPGHARLLELNECEIRGCEGVR